MLKDRQRKKNNLPVKTEIIDMGTGAKPTGLITNGNPGIFKIVFG
jgi:hypothetical protein